MDYTNILGLLGVFLACYACYIAIVRLYLSPVAKFPGPRLAALTFWYEFYYDVVKGGKYTWKIAQLHDQYGPIVRINPFEIHINDPEFYDELYVNASKRKTEIWSWTVSPLWPKLTVLFIASPHRYRCLELPKHYWLP